ncbi:MAG: L,D-transpeptidase family protein [Acidobacteriia bacterium]|nr:L,D-transpeptidase family protein [Terriglobia bacterium]
MLSRFLILPLVIGASALGAAEAGAFRVGPWGLTYARYDAALFGPEQPLPLVLDAEGIALGPGRKLEGARLLVIKAERRCELWVGDRMVKAYRIQLSQQSRGAKSRRYDQRTPEGNYAICAHRPSKYHRSLWISYPGLEDADRGVKEKRIGEAQRRKIAEALDRGECPPQNTRLGGLIMLHGQQRSLTRSLRRAHRRERAAARTDFGEGDADPGAMGEYHDWTAGCIALFNPDIRELYDLLADGTPVSIVALGPVTRPALPTPAGGAGR